MAPTYVSIPAAAEICGVSTRTIRRRIATGDLAAYQLGRRSRTVRIRLADLDAAMRRIPSAGDAA